MWTLYARGFYVAIEKVCGYAHLLPCKRADLLTRPVKRLFLWGIGYGFETGFAKQLRDLGAKFGDQPPDFGWKTRRSLCAKGKASGCFSEISPAGSGLRPTASQGFPGAWEGFGKEKGMAGAGRSAVGAGLGTALGAGSRELWGLEKLLQGECCGAARTELDLYWATGLGRVLGCPVWQKRARAVPRPRT